MLANMLIC